MPTAVSNVFEAAVTAAQAPDFIVQADGGGDYTTIAAGVAAMEAAYDGSRDWIVEVRANTAGSTQTFIDGWINFSSNANGLNAKKIVRAREGDTIRIQGSAASGSGNIFTQLRNYCMVEGDFLIDGGNWMPNGLHTDSKMNWIVRQDVACSYATIKGITGQYFRKSPISDINSPDHLMLVDCEVTFAGDWNVESNPANPDQNEPILFTQNATTALAVVRTNLGTVAHPSGGHSPADLERGSDYVFHDCITSNDWTGYGNTGTIAVNEGNRGGISSEWEGTKTVFIEHTRSCYSMPASDNEYTGFGRVGGSDNSYLFNSYIYCPRGDGGSATVRYSTLPIDGVRFAHCNWYHIGAMALAFGPLSTWTANYLRFREFKIYNCVMLDLWNDPTYNQVNGWGVGADSFIAIQNAYQHTQDPMPWYDRIEMKNCIVPTGFKLAVMGNGETQDTTVYEYTIAQLEANWPTRFSGNIEVDNNNAAAVFNNPNITKSRIYDNAIYKADWTPLGSALNNAVAATTLSSSATNDTVINVNDAAWFRNNRGHDTTYLPYQQVEIGSTGVKNVIDVNLTNNTITLDDSVTAANGESVWLVDKTGKTAKHIGAIQ